MVKRSAFLLSSGSVLAAGAATKAAFGGGITPNIIIPGRGGTAYLQNIPVWTPKAALDHPLTILLNRNPRFTRKRPLRAVLLDERPLAMMEKTSFPTRGLHGSSKSTPSPSSAL